MEDRELERLNNHLMAVEESTPPKCRVYNSDAADVDLEKYSQQVDTPPQRKHKWGWLIVILLAAAAAVYLFLGGILPWN